MVRRSSTQAHVSDKMHNEEFTIVDAILSTKEQRQKASYHHRYKTLKAKVKDVVGSTNGAAEESPVGTERLLSQTDFSPTSHNDNPDDYERSNDSRQPSPSLRGGGSAAFADRAAYPNDKVNDIIEEEDDLTDPAEWRKFIDSVKKEVAERSASIRLDSGDSRAREGEDHSSHADSTEELKAGLRTPISFRRLLSLNNRGDKRSEDEEEIKRSLQQDATRSRSKSPIKHPLSPLKFRRRTDSSTSTNKSDESVDLVQSKVRNSFRIPRFPSPSRRSPYAQLGKPVRDLPLQDNWEKKDSAIVSDVTEFITPEPSPNVIKEEPTPRIEPMESNEPVISTHKKIRKGRRKKTPPAAKPIPAEIQELNEQILRAVGSAMDDDDTTGDPSQMTRDAYTQDDSIGLNGSSDLLSNIKISTTSGIQVKGEKEKEEMRHQTIARRVLNVLIRPNTQETEKTPSVPTSTEAQAKLTSADESTKVISPSDDDFTDATDGPYADVTNIKSSESQKTPNEKIREQLKVLKAKTEHITLKKKFEKSRKKYGKGVQKSLTKTKSSSKSKPKAAVEKVSSYESFDSFSSKTDGNCFTSCLWCFFDSKSDTIEDEKTLNSDVSLDTYESEWGTGRPLPILSPSDFSAERDDVFDVIEKGLCGTI